MEHKKGFTLIEVTIAVFIIGILATLTIVTFSGQQIKARDSARSSRASIIADSLEKYYTEHLEYPSPRALLNTYGGNTGDAVSSLLSIKEKGVLVMPQAAGGTTNSLAPSLGNGDVIAYIAQSTVGNDNCQNSIQGGCDEFTLSYKKEDGSTVTIQSINKGRADNPNTPLQAPSKPTLVATQSSNTITATSSTPTCLATGISASYSFRTQVGAGAWSPWSTWGSSNTITRSSNVNGTAYSFQVHIRCSSSTFMSDTSPDSDVATITYYTVPTAPSTPTLSLSPAAGTVTTSATATTSTVSCDYGTPQYAIDYRTNDGTWTAGAWGTGAAKTVNANQGVKYGFRATARCVNGTQTATSNTTGESTVATGIAAPAVPTVYGGGQSNPNWGWTASSCPAGTWPHFFYQLSDSFGVGGWIDVGSTTTAYNPAATSQGVNYNIFVAQQCWSNYATSPGAGVWGPNVYIPVTHVTVDHWSAQIDSNGYPKVYLKTYTGVCASNLVRESSVQLSWYQPTHPDNTTGWFTATGTYTNSFTAYKMSNDVDTVELRVTTRCRNASTGSTADSSNAQYDDAKYDIGNLLNSSGKYLLSCKPQTGYQSYCAGGYDLGGTKNTTNSTTLGCNVKASGISDTTIRNTARFSFGTASLCWNA